MKKMKKLIPFVMTAALLAGCSQELGLKDQDKTVVNVENAGEDINLTTNQEIFEKLFESQGASAVANEIVYTIAKDLVNKSENNLLGKKGTYKVAGYTFEYERLAEKIKDKFDGYYTATYKKNGLFNEKLLINSLLNSGYNIAVPAVYYEETTDNLLGYKELADQLKGDYTQLIEKTLIKDVYLELLKEEYIFEVHSDYLKSTSTSSETAYSAYAKAKYVEYFSYTPSKSSEANEINTKITNELDALLETKADAAVTKDEFKNLVVNKFESILKEYELDNLVKEFAKINYKAADGIYSKGTVGVLEEKYKDKYLNIYDAAEKAKLTNDEITEATSLISTYSSNSSYSIFNGYELKQLDVANKKYYNDLVVSTKSSTVINSSIDAKLKVNNDKLDLTNGFLDYYNNNNPLFKLDGTYYIVRVEPIYNHKYVKATDKVEKSSDAAILDAVELLATHSSYTSNAIKYYLDEYYEAGNLVLHNEDVYNYLNETYNFKIEE